MFKCQNIQSHETLVTFENLIFIEISVGNELAKIKISDIPTELRIKDEEFELCALIIYTVNHFKSLVFYKNRVIELDDIKRRPMLRRKNLTVIPQICIFKKKV